jgi:hypothetical protein
MAEEGASHMDRLERKEVPKVEEPKKKTLLLCFIHGFKVNHPFKCSVDEAILPRQRDHCCPFPTLPAMLFSEQLPSFFFPLAFL